jgi:Methyltransferase domain
MEIANSIKASWIYDFSDYQQMYDLTESDLSKAIFDFSAGIASFNAEATRRGMQVISADSSYDLSPEKMKIYAQHFLQDMVSQLKEYPNRLRDKSDMTRVIDLWKKTEETFLQDYAVNQAQHRYCKIQLPKMPYKTHQFDLVLCTDFIFHHLLSSEDIAFIVKELCRVATEVRIFPLLDNQGKTSEELGPLMLMLQQKNYGVEVREVPYKTLKGGNAMLRIWEQECHL